MKTWLNSIAMGTSTNTKIISRAILSSCNSLWIFSSPTLKVQNQREWISVGGTGRWYNLWVTAVLTCSALCIQFCIQEWKGLWEFRIGPKQETWKHPSNVGNSINQFMYLDSNLCMGFVDPPLITQILVIKKREIRENDPYIRWLEIQFWWFNKNIWAL